MHQRVAHYNNNVHTDQSFKYCSVFQENNDKVKENIPSEVKVLKLIETTFLFIVT